MKNSVGLQPLQVSARSEWAPLRAVIVGSALGAQIPRNMDCALHAIDFPGLPRDELPRVPRGPYPSHVIQETEEDLELFCSHLRDAGVDVHRPLPIDLTEQHGDGHWRADGYYVYCPRDTIFTIDERVFAAPMVLRHRQHESRAYRPLFAASAWEQCPLPELKDAMYDPLNAAGLTLCEVEPAFDAANILRFNDDILYLISNTGNRPGARLLQEMLGPRYRVHTVADVYRDRHIDTTFIPLREGLLLCNPERVKEEDLPGFLRGWDILWSPEMVPIPALSEWGPASPWIGMNILSISPSLAAVEERQVPLMRALKSRGIDSMPVRLRHCRTLGGGPHCITVDVARAHS